MTPYQMIWVELHVPNRDQPGHEFIFRKKLPFKGEPINDAYFTVGERYTGSLTDSETSPLYGKLTGREYLTTGDLVLYARISPDPASRTVNGLRVHHRAHFHMRLDDTQSYDIGLDIIIQNGWEKVEY